MPIIEPRPLRIIAAELDAQRETDPARARRFDYAALARHDRAQRVARQSGDPAAVSPESGESAPEDDATRLDRHHEQAIGDDPEAAAAPADSADSLALLARLPAAMLPAVDALFRTQGHFLDLARSLAREVAAFCGDPAVADGGNWEVRMPLDPRMLPDTTLYLSLSRFSLSLRFDTQGIETRQLLFDHSSMLERELDALLRAWNTPRDIELTVW